MSAFSSQRMVLVVLYAYADGGVVWPSVTAIARKSGLSRRTVQRALEALTTRGLIKRVAS